MTNKFKPCFKGPYVIFKVYPSELAYDITQTQGRTCIQAHFSQLRPWINAPNYLLKDSYFRQFLDNFSVDPIPSLVHDPSLDPVPPIELDTSVSEKTSS